MLYRNNGDGTFADVTKASGLDKDVAWATGVSFGDFDGDGKIDLFVSALRGSGYERSSAVWLKEDLPVQADRGTVRSTWA